MGAWSGAEVAAVVVVLFSRGGDIPWGLVTLSLSKPKDEDEVARAPADVVVSSILETPPSSALSTGEEEEEDERLLCSSVRESWDLESSKAAGFFWGVRAFLS